MAKTQIIVAIEKPERPVKSGRFARMKPLDHNKHPIRKSLQKIPHWWQRIRITPELAYHWLLNSQALSKATGRAFNRHIWFEQVQDVAALIHKGKFPYGSEDRIVISYTEEWGCVISNGQHRLAAIVLADKTVTTWVASNIWLDIKEYIRRQEIARWGEEIDSPEWWLRACGEREEIDSPEWWLRANGFRDND
jgi:hypothetical protein